jgi:acyl carrier protein
MEMDPSDVPDDAAIGRLKNGDSLAHMRLILALKEYINAQLPPDVIVATGSLSDIANILDDKEVSSANR